MINKMLMVGAALVACADCMAESESVKSSPFAREYIEWQDLWVENADVQKADLPRVLMLGDSISRQYRDKVSKLIWATITSPKNATEGRVAKRNAAADKVIGAQGDIAVDDLGAISRAHPELISGDKVHFTGAGSDMLADAVAASILKAIGK